MARNTPHRDPPDPPPTPTASADLPLSPQQREAWFAWMRVMLRLTYEMNRQLSADSDLSLPDYHVLNALADSPDGRLQLNALAARIGWERSRLSHHLQRMSARGLVHRTPSLSDRRATDAILTAQGQSALLAATPGHVRWVRELFFDGLDAELLPGLARALDQIHAQILEHGSLPTPGPPQQRFAAPGGPADRA